jgi:hypothetical protein
MLEVAFVHLGDNLPKHLVDNLKVIKSNFKDLQLHLILNSSLAVPDQAIPFVEIHVLKVPEEVSRILFELAPDPNFRNGFWKLTLERLFVLGEFHELKADSKILHVESDVFLFPNFPVDKFDSLKKISWLKVSTSRDVASLVYFPSLTETRKFLARMMDELRLGNWRDDMEMLSFLMQKFPDDYDYLPSLNPNHLELKSDEANTNWIERELTSGFENFQGVFDGVHLGIWLAGWDPRNSYGITRIRDLSLISNARGLLNPQKVDFYFDNNGSLRYVTGEKNTCIYSLHIHSKSSRIFSSGWKSEFERLVNHSTTHGKLLEFNPRIFMALVKESWSNGTLLAFIMYSNKHSKRILRLARRLIGAVTRWKKRVNKK